MRVQILAITGTVVLATAAFTLQEREAALAEPAATDVLDPDTIPVVNAAVGFVAPTAPIEWSRPHGPVRVALQAGHWKAAEAPDEQKGLRTNGTRGGGRAEWEVNLQIATLARKLIEDAGYAVEILPTTIPPGYWADLFVSIHADGNNNSAVSGYRAAAPRRDRTGRAADFVRLLEQTYGEATGLKHYPTVTRRMTGYYAFNSRRYHHALDPMTTGVILETGFLTSPADRRVLVDAPERAARGIADAVIQFLEPLRAEVESATRVASTSGEPFPSTNHVR